jgi:hypothetical protein
MSASFLERLSRFTPDAGRLERDALLFAAGRRSARPNRGWIALAATLASTQALSLALLWLHPTTSSLHPSGPVASAPSVPEPLEPATSRATDSGSLWSARHNLLASDHEEPPTDHAVTLITSEPPLRAFGPPPASILN